jgi:hypothetical protein
MKLEREHCRILPGAKSIDQGLTHEQPDCNSNSHSNHGTANVNAIAIGGYPPSLRQSRLKKVC